MQCHGREVLSVCALSLAVSGCGSSFWSARESNPVIKDNVIPNTFVNQSLDLFATTASRRLIIVSQARNGEQFQSCAEPSPDVGEAFSAAIAAGIDQSIALQQGNDLQLGGRSAGNVVREATTAVAPLLYRTQGLQLYRDAQYSLCVDVLSGRMTSEEYRLKKDQYFTQAVDLIKMETTKIVDAQTAFFTNMKPFGLSVVGGGEAAERSEAGGRERSTSGQDRRGQVRR